MNTNRGGNLHAVMHWAAWDAATTKGTEMTGYESKRAAAQDKMTQDMEFARIEIQVGNKLIEGFLTRQQLHHADDPWALIEHKAAKCVATLKEMYDQG